ncbi:TIGR00282 family metallophosphoesterase [Acholeplasma hippikon]|nr:TIGR00282 family metallophosphoesterase [Acholeplasma hippikon]
MKILFIGDIYGEAGVNYLLENISYLRQTYQPNLIIANAENAKEGRGITLKIYKELMKSGISLLTMGNHTWKNKELETFIEGSNVIRPINDRSNKGNGYKIIKYNDKKILVLNALGRAFMAEEYDNPFLMVKEVLEKETYDYSILDFHAETTSEKVAMAHFLDGKIDAVVGTHTHIQTNDNMKYPKGTLYISDIGMTGPMWGVIGVDKDIIVNRFVYAESVPNQVAKGPRQINAVLITLEPTRKIEKIHLEEMS